MTSHHPQMRGRGCPSRASSRSGFQNDVSSPSENDTGDLKALICAVVQQALQGVMDASSVDQAGRTAIQPVVQSIQEPAPPVSSAASPLPLAAQPGQPLLVNKTLHIHCFPHAGV